LHSDDGETGYIAIVTNQDINHTHFVNSSSYIQVLKTEDGGQTWSCPADLDIQTALDSALKNQGNSIYQSTFNINIVIDANENLHIIAHIVEYISPGVQLSMPYGEHGMFDLYTTDGGTTYLAQLLAHPQTSYASFGTAGIDEIIEFSRQFASRSWDGSKLFFGWFDSDTAVYPFPFFNSHPDLRLVGFDVNTNTWTTDLSNLPSINGGENITIGSSAHQKCTFGTGSYYSIDNAGTYSIPVTYMVVSGNGTYTSQPCDFFFIDCAAPTGNFIYSGHPLPVPVLHLSTLCDGGNGVVLSINEKSKDLIVSSNYPNPFTGKTSVDVTLPKAGDVSVEISNVVGQKLVSATYQNLHSGLNTLTLDASSLAHGLYFFTVKAGSKSVTKTMTVE